MIDVAKTKVSLKSMAEGKAEELAAQLGPGASVIVMISVPVEGNHENYYSYGCGPCLSRLGLLEVGASMIRRNTGTHDQNELVSVIKDMLSVTDDKEGAETAERARKVIAKIGG